MFAHTWIKKTHFFFIQAPASRPFRTARLHAYTDIESIRTKQQKGIPFFYTNIRENRSSSNRSDSGYAFDSSKPTTVVFSLGSYYEDDFALFVYAVREEIQAKQTERMKMVLEGSYVQSFW